MIGALALAGLTLLIVLMLVRLMFGPTLHDRAMAVGSLVVKAALACAAAAVLLEQTEAADAALMLALCAFVLHVAVFKFFRARSLQPPLVREESAS